MRIESVDTAELHAVSRLCLGWLAENVEELERFMTLSGHSPASLRAAVETDRLAAGLIDYFGRNEPQLLALCANSDIPVERVMRLWHRLNPEG